MSESNIFIALGSNIGDARSQFDAALAALAAYGCVRGKSRLYSSRPYGYEAQADFTNAAIRFDSALEPLALLERLQTVEKALGKAVVRPNGPRCIDLDLLFYGERMMEVAALSLPHPRAHERDFVLMPLCDLAPEFTHPSRGLTLRELLENLQTSHFTGEVENW